MEKQTEITEKLARVTRWLAAEKLGGVLLNAQHNFAWLTAGGRNGIDQSRDLGAGTLLVRADGRCFALANRIELTRLLTEELADGAWEAVEFPWEAERAQPLLVAERAQALLEPGAALGSDLPLGNLRVVEGSFARLRYQLTLGEIERYRALGKTAGAALGAFVRTLQPGLSEQEIAGQATAALAAHGLAAVVNLVAADERLAQFRHPVPTARRWEKTVMVAVCARQGGLTVSLSRIVCAGAVPEELRRRTSLTAAVNAQLWAATQPGATGAELYEVAARSYAAAGFPGEESLHHQGGAIGYRTREWVAHPQSAEQVQTRQAFAWNPSITGTKVEETLLLADGAAEVVTTSPDWPLLEKRVGEQTYWLPDVLAL